MRGALFDVGGTLVDQWLSRDALRARILAWAERSLGPQPWLEALVDADVAGEIDGHHGAPNQQATDLCLAAWLGDRGAAATPEEIERVRLALSLPLDQLAALAPGTRDALGWCRDRGMRVVLISNTFTRGDDEVAADARRYGIEDLVDGVVTSCSTGWFKPHPRIFERALDVAGVAATEAFIVGDRLDTDVAGAKALGIRAILKRGGSGDPREGRPETGVEPDAAVETLAEVPAIVARW